MTNRVLVLGLGAAVVVAWGFMEAARLLEREARRAKPRPDPLAYRPVIRYHRGQRTVDVPVTYHRIMPLWP